MAAERPELIPATSLPSTFRFGAARSAPAVPATPPAPSLGPLAAFTGNWQGSGFNTIFRPDSSVTPTPLPTPVAGSDNVLELNLTSESLSFSPMLGSVPNRGMVQADAFLNGVPYLQAISDVTQGPGVGIHLEPGLWVIAPTTTDPAEQPTLIRMASIPHGTTILAQGTWSTLSGAPVIPPVDITPFGAIEAGGSPGGKIRFPSQTATETNTARIPQDLTAFISAGTITQAILDDPNSILRNHIAGQKISATTVISIATAPSTPLFGGGTDNIAFLLGNAAAQTNPIPAGQNAQSVQLTATFWIETVEHTILVPIFAPGEHPMTLSPEHVISGGPNPRFIVDPPVPIRHPGPITFTSTQIQYSQTVILNFNGLSWPHVSVATLVPASPIPIPPSAWK